MAPVAAMTTATVAAASATVATTVTTTVATVAAAPHEFNVRGCRLLFVEDIEGRQANVGDFLFAKEFVHVADGRRWQSGAGSLPTTAALPASDNAAPTKGMARGGGFSKISLSHYGCSTARNKGTCSNLLTVRRETNWKLRSWMD
jgi:hypothetical protein